MNTISRFLILPFIIFLPFNSFCQEWLVEMNPEDGIFEAVGPVIEDVYTIFGGLQCKDEVNGQYIFLKTGNSNPLVSLDINNAQIVAETSTSEEGNISILGFHCFENCETLIVIRQDNILYRQYVALLDRVNGSGFVEIGSPYENTDAWSLLPILQAFDPVNNLLYLYSAQDALLHAMSIPSGEITNSYSITSVPMNLAFDEINNKLYALEFTGSQTYKLMVFDQTIADFTQVGESFTAEGNYYTATIDGNSQRMLVTGHSSFIGSYLMSVDLLTGELLVNVQTVLPDGGAFGGKNAINGQYFNSTDQLITLHWGDGSTVTSAESAEVTESKAWVYPNPNQGTFKIHLNEYRNEIYRLEIVNLIGQIIYENNSLRNDQSLDLRLSPGYFIANIFDTDGLPYESVPFVIE